MEDNKGISNTSNVSRICFQRERRDSSGEQKCLMAQGSIGTLLRVSLLVTLRMSILFLLLIPSLTLGKEAHYTIKGRVIDASTEEGLGFANIVVENTNLHANTNEKGEFTFVLPMGEYRLLVSYVGYKTEAVKVVEDNSPLVVKLTPSNYLMHEVSVTGTQSTDNEMHSIQLGSAQIKDFAGVMRDPMRSLQLLPGVSTNDEASAKVNVRGGTWDENMVLVNGAEIYRPYHLNEISMASVGVFNFDMVKSIDFSAGGFGAKYGNALSSITSVDYKEGNRDNFAGQVDLGVMDLSASFEGPINQNSSFILAARGSYLGYLLQKTKVSPDIYAGYYDVQGNINYELSKLNKLRVTFIYSEDNAIQSPSNMPSMYSYYGNINGNNTLISRYSNLLLSYGGNYSSSLLSIGFDNVLSDQLISRTLVYYSGETEHQWPLSITTVNFKYQGSPDLWSNQSINVNMSDDLAITTLSFDQELELKATSFLDLDAGVGVKRIDYNYAPNMYGAVTYETNTAKFPDTTVAVSPYNMGSFDTTAIKTPTYALEGYLQQTLQMSDNLKLNFGARFDYFDMDKQGECSPRASLSYLMPLGIDLNAAWGIYYQLPNYDQLRTAEASKENTRFQKATHYVLGLEKEFFSSGRLSIDFYQKYYSDLIPVIRRAYGGLDYGTEQNDAVGFAKGVDLQWSMSFKIIDFSLSYSYLVAKEKTIGVDADYYPRATDQRHTASMVVALNLGDEWVVNMKGFYGSGYAYTPCVTKYNSTIMTDLWVQGNKNSSYYPAYERVDLRIIKTFFLSHNPLQVYLDVTNILNRRNVWSYNYTYDAQGNPKIDPMLLYGTVPTIGISYPFQF